MNRNEIIDLLEILISCYPNTKIADPSAMATSWEMVLSDYEAPGIYKAARLHMSTSPFFPKPSDLIDARLKAEMIYSDRQRPRLEPQNKAKVTAIPDGMTEDEFLDAIWNVDEPDAVDTPTLGRSLPYEN